jgi:hypothetical protein
LRGFTASGKSDGKLAPGALNPRTLGVHDGPRYVWDPEFGMEILNSKDFGPVVSGYLKARAARLVGKETAINAVLN